MTAPVRPLTMRDVLRAYALGERMNDWVLASRAVSHLVPQESPNYDLCAEMCRLHASTCENDFIGLAEYIVNDATLARPAEVERERDEATIRAHQASMAAEFQSSDYAAAEQRLARLRPLVRAVILWERLRGYVGELEARIVMLNIIRNHFDPTDRAWATEEER